MTENKPNTSKDDEIMQLIDSEPARGFTLLFHTYYSEICGHIYRIIKNSAATEDIAQELFSELWTKRETLEIRTSPGAYLHRMAVSRTLNYIRDNKKHAFHSEDALRTERARTNTPLQKMHARELSQIITNAVEALPERCRIVFMLSRYEDMTNKQIAESMDISVKTVENQMTKALRNLREAVNRFNEDG